MIGCCRRPCNCRLPNIELMGCGPALQELSETWLQHVHQQLQRVIRWSKVRERCSQGLSSS
jgi:hypothetical protein